MLITAAVVDQEAQLAEDISPVKSDDEMILEALSRYPTIDPILQSKHFCMLISTLISASVTDNNFE